MERGEIRRLGCLCSECKPYTEGYKRGYAKRVKEEEKGRDPRDPSEILRSEG